VSGSGEPEVSNLPEFEFIATIQIDQWERFPPKKIVNVSFSLSLFKNLRHM
jgi:hypothetical protein